eukprot:COSAG03_NODE_14451_length_463_cov_36.093407_2_plen_77_part_01
MVQYRRSFYPARKIITYLYHPYSCTSRLAKRRERGPRQGETEHTEAEAEAEAGRAAERQSGRETERDVEARCGGARL